MTGSGVNISSSIGGGSYSIESRLDEVRSKLSNICKKIKELEFNVMSCELNPTEIIPETGSVNNSQNFASDHSDSNNIVYVRNNMFVVSIPRELMAQLNEYMDINHSLMVSERELVDALNEQRKRQYGHNDSSQFVSENIAHYSL